MQKTKRVRVSVPLIKTEDGPVIQYFHSVSIPQLINDAVGAAVLNELKSDKIKHCKYEFHVLYHQKRRWQEADKTKKAQYQLKRRKFMIGKTSVKDASDGPGAANELIVKSMRTRNKELLINSDSFKKEKVEALGGFNSKQFWSANLLWGSKQSVQDNAIAAQKFFRSELPMVEVAAGKGQKGSKLSKLESPKVYDVPPIQGDVATIVE